MIEMKVMGIAIDTASGSPIIVLNDIDNRKALPIQIGSAFLLSISFKTIIGEPDAVSMAIPITFISIIYISL